MRTTVLTIVYLVAAPNMVLGQSTKAAAEIKQLNAQAEKAESETALADQLTEKARLETKNVAIDLTIKQGTTMPLFHGLMIPVVEGIIGNTKGQANEELFRLVGTDNVRAADLRATIARFESDVVPEDKWRIKDLRSKVLDFARQWSAEPSSREKELAVKSVQETIPA